MKLSLLLCGLLALAVPTAMFAESPDGGKSSVLKNTVILVIRHAEKPDYGYGLSADGESRARAYVNYFKNFTIDGQPLKLDYLFSDADSKKVIARASPLSPPARRSDSPLIAGLHLSRGLRTKSSPSRTARRC